MATPSNAITMPRLDCSNQLTNCAAKNASTVKGKGVSFIENAVSWHHKVPTDEEMTRALSELDAAEHALEVA